MLKIMYLIGLSIVCFCNYTMAQCHQNDWTALHQLYEQTNGNNWQIKTNWNIVSGQVAPQNCNLSLLFGIALNENNRVSGIELPANNLVGTIPAEIGLLNELDEMQLSNNILSGNLPAEIGQLENLATLEVEYNSLSGALPSEIGNLSNLEVLSLNNNNFSAAIPPEFGDLSGLSDLYLNNNQLSGCFDENLSILCAQFYYYDNVNITAGNNFEATWANFCDFSEGQCSNCAEVINLSSSSNTNQTYQAGESINSTETINANITYQAGSFILLNIGFNAPSTFDFGVFINACN